MLRWLPASILLVITSVFYSLNIFFWVCVLFLVSFFRMLMPVPNWRESLHCFANTLPDYMIKVNDIILSLTSKINWQITGTENLKRKDWYLILANHQSWIDILVLYKVFGGKIPAPKFFMKKELLWQLPIASQAALLLDYPFMKRYSRDFLKKHPELKGKDIETTKKSCEKFKNIPTTIINFVEGGRFKQERHQKQNSPYCYLLRPKAGGVAFTLSAMGQHLHTILNVTIVYPQGKPNFWAYLSGRITHIIVQVEPIPITDKLLGDYENDRTFKRCFQNWLNKLWQKKDKQIATILETNATEEGQSESTMT